MSTLYSYFPNTLRTTKVRPLFDSLYDSWSPHTLNISGGQTRNTYGQQRTTYTERKIFKSSNPQSMLTISLRTSICAEAVI